MPNLGFKSQFFRGGKIAEIPKSAGIYAWYYKPRIADWNAISGQLPRILDSNVQIETTTSLRYGMQLRSTAPGKIFYNAERRDIHDTISDLEHQEQEAVIRFLTDEAFISFSRPLYIGIAKNLNRRVFGQHYSSLVKYWDDSSEVHRYLSSEPHATVEQLVAALQLKRSFALEARSRGIAPGDLIVYAHPTNSFSDVVAEDENSDDGATTRRSLERILHLLADPVCGRR